MNWIRQCFTTVSFFVVVIVIGNRSRSFVPTCGIHQGDPLLPYLFILVAQALSDGLAEFTSNKVCRGVAVSPRSPRISHMLFVDDCFIFMENGMDHAWCLKLLLYIYCDQAGQKIKFAKSKLFVSPNMQLRDVEWLKRIFYVKCVDKPRIYLGANLDFTCRKGRLFSHVMDRIQVK